MRQEAGENFEGLPADLTQPETINEIIQLTGSHRLNGIVINGGGPPALPFAETSISDWDQAYRQILRWKVDLTQSMLPFFQSNHYGRFVFIESSSIKQPIETMMLSTSLRLAVVGFVKSLSQEMSASGITFNVLAPGYHHTPAINRIVNKRSKMAGIPADRVLQEIEESIPVKKLGNPDHFASLAVWLLSPLSDYVTGQVFTVDGGMVTNTL
jgi:3-oxoacyl-[acyl-carrier protein] reductase